MLNPIHWQPTALRYRLPIAAHEIPWLLETGSLTARIRQACPQMHVEILSEQWEVPLPFEAQRLKLRDHRKAWVRCVLLKCNDTPWVYGRTVIPRCRPGNPWYPLQRLGTQPLGEVLFRLKQLQRTPLQVASTFGQAWPYLPEAFQTQKMNARHCLFRRQGAELLLSEVFLATPSPSP